LNESLENEMSGTEFDRMCTAAASAALQVQNQLLHSREIEKFKRSRFHAAAHSSLAIGAAILLWACLPPAEALAECRLERYELPVTMVDLSPTVKVKINGVEVSMIVDSGAFFGVLTPDTMRQYGLKRLHLPDYLRFGGIGGDDAETMLTRIDKFTLNTAVIRKAEFLVAGNEFGRGIAGVLGQNILHQFDVEYDLANGVIRLVHPSADCNKRDLAYWAGTAPHSVFDLSWAREDRLSTVGNAFINRKQIRVAFDSGASASLLSLEAAKRLGIRPGRDVPPDGSVYGFGRHRVDTWIVPVDSVKIGDEEIRATRIWIGDLGAVGADIDMLVGADFMLSHRIYVANSQDKVYFTYSGGPVFRLTTDAADAPASDQSAAAGTTAETDTPKNADGFSRRGMAMLARKEYARALADLSRACEIAPGTGIYFYQRAMAYKANRQDDLGLTDLDEALRLQADLVEARMARADLRLSNGDIDGARRDLDQASHEAPAAADVRFELGQDYVRAHMFELAVTQLDLWIAAHGEEVKFSDALSERCWARALGGFDLDQALKDCEAALDARAKSAEVLDRRGTVHLRSGRYALAAADFDSALAAKPNGAWSLFGRGIARLQLGRSDDGQADLHAAERIRPGITARGRSYGIAVPEAQTKP
jgi:tetratricopeptide (TPR) repeat protein